MNEPRPQIGSAAQALCFDTEGAEKGLVGEVLGDRDVTDLAETEAVDVRCMPPIQLGESSPAISNQG